jgi:WD40 repeat protein
VKASTVKPAESSHKSQQKGGYQHSYNNNTQQTPPPSSYAVSSIAIWDTQPSFKIFSGSHDGFWRLWNPSSNFTKEFEHYMGPPKPAVAVPALGAHTPASATATVPANAKKEYPPKLHKMTITNNYMFVAFDAPCAKIPGGIDVGMVHAWNLASPQDPPMEFHMDVDASAGNATHMSGGSGSDSLSPFAHAGGVSSLLVQPDGLAFTGGKDGLIRCWSMVDAPGDAGGAAAGAVPPAAGKKVFAVQRCMAGHAREVTALARASPTDPILWSGSTDGTMRLWDAATGKCQYMITSETPNAAGQPTGHSGAITALETWDFGNEHFILSSSLDGSVRAWSTKAECMANSLTIDQQNDQQQPAQQQGQHGHHQQHHQQQQSSTSASGIQYPPQGVVSMAVHKDLSNNPLLICGMLHGDICIRALSQQSATVPAFSLLMILNGYHLQCGHNPDRYASSAIRSVVAGPSCTFYTGGEDGKLCVWQIVADFKLA